MTDIVIFFYRRASRTALTAEVPLTDCDISAVDMSAVDASATAHQQETGHAATAVTDVAKDESQLPAETNDTLQNHEPCLDPGSDRYSLKQQVTVYAPCHVHQTSMTAVYAP